VGNEHYTYRLSWSPDDGEYVATCAEFPSLSWLDKDEMVALRNLKAVVADVLKDMQANGETPPVALADKTYSGALTLRLPPQLHQRLAIEAAEARVSLNRLMSLKLATS
jgi:predicted HicB family RNase H-like nuclease